MGWIEALILGLIQGLTEFLPVSSSGHLEIGKYLLGVEPGDNLIFTVMVHGATVLSTLVVFCKDIIKLLTGLFQFQWNEETRYIMMIVVSMIPIAIVGLFFKDAVEAVFDSPKILIIVGFMLLITALILAIAYYRKSGDKEITFGNAFIIGIAQTIAVLPGISRSGATIATGLILGTKKESVAKFSFLMVLVPILGENFLSILSYQAPADVSAAGVGVLPLAVGFVAAFISGLLACTWMINIVKRGKLIWFAVYCFVVALIAIGGSLMA